MKKIKIALTTLSLLMLVACNDYVTDVDPLVDKVEDDLLKDRAQLTFLLNGVHNTVAQASDQMMMLSDGLSDHLIMDGVDNGDATYPQYTEIEAANIRFDNTSLQNAQFTLGEARFMADDLEGKVNAMEFTEEDDDIAAKNNAMFFSKFYGGVTRYYYAAYIGLNETEGGATIDGGAFIPSAQLYTNAIALLNSSLQYGTDLQDKYANTVIAKCLFNQGNYTEAKAYADKGLTSGDEAFKFLYNTDVQNEYHEEAGQRAQWTVPARVLVFLDQDPKEEARLPVLAFAGKTLTHYKQQKYDVAGSPIPFLTWQENELMLAEIAFRAGDSGTALTKINLVRASYSLDALTEVTDIIIEQEREKELFCTGNRLLDQRRLGKFHFAEGWQYLPISQRERDTNPNL